MRSIQNKLLLYMIIMGVIPMLFFTFYYYDLSTKKALDELNNESLSTLEQLDNKLVVKVSRLQNTADILLDDEELYRILSETESFDDDNAEIQNRLDSIYDSFLRGERELRSILLLPLGGGAYVSGEPIPDNDPVRFALKYDDIGSDSGVLSWLGLKEKAEVTDKDAVVAGTILRDARYNKDHAYLATVYMIFSDKLFGEETGAGTVPAILDGGGTDTVSDESISVYDDTVKLIYSLGNKRLSNAFLDSNPAMGQRVYDSSRGSFPMTVDSKKYMVVYYTSPITGWKFVRTVPYEPYMESRQNIGYITALCLILMFALWYTVNFFVIRKMTVPIRQLVDAMKEVADENFDVELKVRSKDEFGIINSGFNSMVVRIKRLFERTIEEEEKRRKQDILMLRYQMNPHFLYNTLSAIRLIAIMNKQTKIAKMLLIMARFLRNAILTVNEMPDINTEIDNISDYISLYQLRYSNMLNVNIDVSPQCRNYRIPGMLCQPIIENSIMHGLHDKINIGEEARIDIKVYEENDFLIISVFDNGKGIEKNKLEELFSDTEEQASGDTKDRLHIGLSNIHKRIKLMFGDDYGIDVESEEGEYTLVRVNLPKK
ncbi:MAG: sensor histidine kinase [Clostridia bacterium]|nr:sensor histidine kinase [Clostridia bacterium]